MEVLIIRHGDAVDDAPGLGDVGRWLSGKGRQVTRQVAGWLAMRDDARPVEIWTSPLVRAVQTAEILAEAATLTDEVSVHPELSTYGNPRDAVRLLARYGGRGPIAVVGHEPGLSTMAVMLLDGVRWPGFKKSGVLAVTWDGRSAARLRFVLNPKDLTVVTDIDRL